MNIHNPGVLLDLIRDTHPEVTTLTIGDVDDKSTWTVSYSNKPTQQTQDSVQTIIDDFNTEDFYKVPKESSKIALEILELLTKETPLTPSEQTKMADLKLEIAKRLGN